MSRKVAREEVFKLLFEGDMNKEPLQDIYSKYEEKFQEESSKNVQEFLGKYSKGITEHYDEIVEAISQNMTGWSLDRIGYVERNLIIFGAYEILFEDIGYEIVVNEAVELAKIYGEEKTPEFVNGVLAKVIKSRG